MIKPRVLVTRRIPDVGLQVLRLFAEVEVWEGERPIPRDIFLQKISHVEGLYCLLTDEVDEALLERASNLRAVSTMSVGFDHIDVGACTKRRIPVGYTPGVLTDTTADCAFALLLAAARRIGEAAEYVKGGLWKTWDPLLFLGQEVSGATLGIIGYGRIGRAMALRATGFGMRIFVNHSRPLPDEVLRHVPIEQVSFDQIISDSDFLSLHVPLTENTHHLINRDVFERMKPTAILINTARGKVVDTKALFEALRHHTIAYAALDVTDPEPLPPNDPLLSLPNCLIVPHIGSASVATRNKMAVMAAENLRAGLCGDPLPHCVNPEVYEN